MIIKTYYDMHTTLKACNDRNKQTLFTLNIMMGWVIESLFMSVE